MRRWFPFALVAAIAPAHAEPPARRAIGAVGGYTHTAALDGGHLGVAWWEPVSTAVTVDGELGVAVATTAAAGTAASLSNPRVRARLRLGDTAAARLALALPAASGRGDGGAVAAAMAAAHRIDPSPWLADATTIAVDASRRWRRPLGELTVTTGASWILIADAADRPLIHADVAGAAAVSDRAELTGAFRTTWYALVTDAPESFVHALALGVRFRSRRVVAAIELAAPIDDADRAADVVHVDAAIRVEL